LRPARSFNRLATRRKRRRNPMTNQANVETIETKWWQPLSCGCDPIVENLETQWWQPLSCGCDPIVEDLETQWWQPLSCGCDPIVEH